MSTKKQRVVARKVATITQEADCGPCYILPADAASYEKMADQIQNALSGDYSDYWTDLAKEALAAIGIKQPKP